MTCRTCPAAARPDSGFCSQRCAAAYGTALERYYDPQRDRTARELKLAPHTDIIRFLHLTPLRSELSMYAHPDGSFVLPRQFALRVGAHLALEPIGAVTRQPGESEKSYKRRKKHKVDDEVYIKEQEAAAAGKRVSKEHDVEHLRKRAMKLSDADLDAFRRELDAEAQHRKRIADELLESQRKEAVHRVTTLFGDIPYHRANLSNAMLRIRDAKTLGEVKAAEEQAMKANEIYQKKVREAQERAAAAAAATSLSMPSPAVSAPPSLPPPPSFALPPAAVPPSLPPMMSSSSAAAKEEAERQAKSPYLVPQTADEEAADLRADFISQSEFIERSDFKKFYPQSYKMKEQGPTILATVKEGMQLVPSVRRDDKHLVGELGGIDEDDDDYDEYIAAKRRLEELEEGGDLEYNLRKLDDLLAELRDVEKLRTQQQAAKLEAARKEAAEAAAVQRQREAAEAAAAAAAPPPTTAQPAAALAMANIRRPRPGDTSRIEVLRLTGDDDTNDEIKNFSCAAAPSDILCIYAVLEKPGAAQARKERRWDDITERGIHIYNSAGARIREVPLARVTDPPDKIVVLGSGAGFFAIGHKFDRFDARGASLPFPDQGSYGMYGYTLDAKSNRTGTAVFVLKEWELVKIDSNTGKELQEKKYEHNEGEEGDSPVCLFVGAADNVVTLQAVSRQVRYYSPELAEQWKITIPENWLTLSAYIDDAGRVCVLAQNVATSAISCLVFLAQTGMFCGSAVVDAVPWRKVTDRLVTFSLEFDNAQNAYANLSGNAITAFPSAMFAGVRAVPSVAEFRAPRSLQTLRYHGPILTDVGATGSAENFEYIVSRVGKEHILLTEENTESYDVIARIYSTDLSLIEQVNLPHSEHTKRNLTYSPALKKFYFVQDEKLYTYVKGDLAAKQKEVKLPNNQGSLLWGPTFGVLYIVDYESRVTLFDTHTESVTRVAGYLPPYSGTKFRVANLLPHGLCLLSMVTGMFYSTEIARVNVFSLETEKLQKATTLFLPTNALCPAFTVGDDGALYVYQVHNNRSEYVSRHYEPAKYVRFAARLLVLEPTYGAVLRTVETGPRTPDYIASMDIDASGRVFVTGAEPNSIVAFLPEGVSAGAPAPSLSAAAAAAAPPARAPFSFAAPPPSLPQMSSSSGAVAPSAAAAPSPPSGATPVDLEKIDRETAVVQKMKIDGDISVSASGLIMVPRSSETPGYRLIDPLTGKEKGSRSGNGHYYFAQDQVGNTYTYAKLEDGRFCLVRYPPDTRVGAKFEASTMTRISDGFAQLASAPFALSPKGDALVFVNGNNPSDQKLFVYDTAKVTEQPAPIAFWNYASQVAVLSGKRFACISQMEKHTTFVFSFTGQQLSKFRREVSIIGGNISIAADASDKVFVADIEFRSINIFDANSGKIIRSVQRGKAPVSLSISKDGALYVFQKQMSTDTYGSLVVLGR